MRTHFLIIDVIFSKIPITHHFVFSPQWNLSTFFTIMEPIKVSILHYKNTYSYNWCNLHQDSNYTPHLHIGEEPINIFSIKCLVIFWTCGPWVDCSKKGNISWYFPQRPTLCKQYLLCIAFTMVDSSLTKTIALIILFANIKEVHYRRPQLDTFYIVIWQQKSIIQLYKAVIRHYRIFQSLHNFPPRTFPPKNLATRVNTMENINLIVYYKTIFKKQAFWS